jgi:cytochrome b6-f complex iron-sulfur subunit
VLVKRREFRLTRRGLIDGAIRVCTVITGIGLIGPALAYLWPAAKSGPVKSREDVGAAEGWDVWQAKKVSVGGKPVLVVRTDQGFVALSAVCTHLGCLVEFDSAGRKVRCPCHAAVFDLQGRVTGGPPPRPLPLYSVSEAQGKVYVSA